MSSIHTSIHAFPSQVRAKRGDTVLEQGSDAKKLEAHSGFVNKLMDALNSGIGDLVDADMAKESAKLQALQVKQQLGVQALSIANSQPQIILNLFNG